MLNKKKLNKQFVRQHGKYSCGLACLASIVNYYGGDVSQSKLMQISGTTLNGTSMLGLYQAAQKIGMDVKGFEADIEHLKKIEAPVILHVMMKDNQQHFVVCYGYDRKFIIGDPGWGITEYSTAELKALWKSKALLQLKPGKNFRNKKHIVKEQWRWLRELAKDDIPVLGVATFFGIIIAILGLSTAVYSQKLIDQYLPGKEYDKIYIGLVLLAGLLLIRSVFSYLRGILMVRQSRDLNQRIISGFLSKVLYLPQSFFKGLSSGDLIARMNDARRIQTAVSVIVGSMVIEILVVGISSYYIFYLSGLIGLISISSILFFLFLAWRYHNKIVAGQREVMQTYALNESNYIDILQGSATIKSFGRERVFIDRLTGVYNVFQEKVYNLGFLGNKYGLMTGSITALYIVLIIFAGISLVLKGRLQLGEFVAIMSVGGSLIPSLANLTLANIQIQEAKVAFERMHELVKEMDQPVPEIKKQLHDIESIEIKNLKFRFPGKRPLLKQANLVLRRGQIAALFGDVGSGKSTLVDILQRFYFFEDGKVLVNGRDWNSIELGAWRKKLAVVPQKEKIFNSTVIDNISLGNNPNEYNDVVKFCKQQGFHPYIEKLQQGYMTITGENGIRLSGGQRQLVSLARALYKNPDILILDEATASMDKETEDFVFQLLRRRSDLAILIITHREDLVEKVDTIYQLANKTITSVRYAKARP